MKDPDKINLWVLVPLAVMVGFAYMMVISLIGR